MFMRGVVPGMIVIRRRIVILINGMGLYRFRARALGGDRGNFAGGGAIEYVCCAQRVPSKGLLVL